jgi:hypothetical protein
MSKCPVCDQTMGSSHVPTSSPFRELTKEIERLKTLLAVKGEGNGREF